MERVRDALLAARRARVDALGNGPEPQLEVSGDSLPPKQAKRSRRRESVGPELRIVRSRTRVLPVSEQTLDRHRIVTALTAPSLAKDAYRMLRTRVSQRLRSNGWNSLCVTGPLQGAGKTVTATNLAVSLAMEPQRSVLLVDLDLRRPSIHEYFGYRPEVGISSYLFEGVAIEDILFSPGIERLVVLPGCENISDSSEVLGSSRLLELAEELKNRYSDRIVIFDMPPLLAVDDALAFSPNVDAVLLVAENGATTEDDLRRAVDCLSNVPILGTVLNKSEGTSSDKYYYY